jgi:xanthine dehydrogenase accessory factor
LARETLRDGVWRHVEADFRGRPGDLKDGVCGGVMIVWVRRLDGEADRDTVLRVAQKLSNGKSVVIQTGADEAEPAFGEGIEPCGLFEGRFVERIEPAPYLLIVGAGHIGRALAKLADDLGFRVTVQDSRADWLNERAFPAGTILEATVEAAARALGLWEGKHFAVLVTRGFMQDVEALTSLASVREMDYVGVLGSRARVATVKGQVKWPWPGEVIRAPVGIEIGAQTPEEIAVSIAAEMIQMKNACLSKAVG